jgi:hypothetical protein
VNYYRVDTSKESLTNPRRWVILVRVYNGDGFSVHIWPNDHAPAHVHVYRAEGLAVVNLLTLGIREAYDMKPADLRRAVAIVEANRKGFLQKWREIHNVC